MLNFPFIASYFMGKQLMALYFYPFAFAAKALDAGMKKEKAQ